MRSITGAVGALTVLLSLPAAFIVNMTTGGNAETVLHFMIGTGFLLIAVSVFSFDMPRWLNWLGALSAGAFGAIFFLQGISNVVDNETIHGIAFGVLGQQVERFLPDVLFVWFLGLLFTASQGKTRTIGWIVMPVIIGIEVATAVGLVIGLDIPNIKVAFLLPVIWLLFESLKSRGTAVGTDRPRAPQAVEATAA